MPRGGARREGGVPGRGGRDHGAGKSSLIITLATDSFQGCGWGDFQQDERAPWGRNCRGPASQPCGCECERGGGATEKPPPVLPPTRLPPDFYLDRVPLTIVNTSSRQEDKIRTEMECKKVDAIVLTYSCNRLQTLDRLLSYWLPELWRLEDVRHHLLCAKAGTEEKFGNMKFIMKAFNDFM